MEDRGIKKWASAYMLQDAKDDYFKLKRPELDEHEIEVINNTIVEAMEHTNEVVVTYFENGQFKPFVGHIHYVDTMNRHIRIMDKFEDIYRINFNDIIDVQMS
ncbi:YolD-like family protein [Bacillus sp. SCS-151]|uniref:YolD-like family protein n=1 Tax=Nanhaiella sioensis TaxID=3115293 RepID=UPI00397DEBEF